MTKQECIANLRELLQPGSTVYTVLRSVARSGMSRNIDVYYLECVDGKVEKHWLSSRVAKAIGETFNTKRDCLRVSGCGMDMGFHVVYNLSRVLFSGGHACTGKRCPSNDHNNAYSTSRHNQCIVCRKDVGDSAYTRLNLEHHLYKVCSETCATGEWVHEDGGYALVHKWL